MQYRSGAPPLPLTCQSLICFSRVWSWSGRGLVVVRSRNEKLPMLYLHPSPPRACILGHASLSIILGLASLPIIPRHASLSALAALLWLSPHAMGARDAQYGLVPSLLLAPLYGGSGGSGARLDSIDWMCLQQCFINSWAPELHSFTIPILLVAMEVSR